MNVDEFGDGSHEAHVETIVGDVALFDGIESGLSFRRVEFLVFFIKIRNYVFDCTLLGLGNLSKGS